MPGARQARRRARPLVEPLEARELLVATISGTVLVGLDVVQSNPSPPALVAGAMVSLDNGAQVVTTGANGTYSFANVAAGSHTVSVMPPAGLVGFSAQGLSYSIVIGANETAYPNLNFALTPKNQALAQNLYELVLERPADAAGFNALVQRLNGGASVGSAFRSLFTSDEFDTKVGPIASMLGAFLPGAPVEIGLLRNAVQLQNLGVSQDATVLGILYSQTFVSEFGDTSQQTNAQFVTFAYQELLRRTPKAERLNFYVGQLNSGAFDRGDVILDLIDTKAFRKRRAVRRGVTVSLAYLGVLGREATATEYARGIRQLKGGLSAAGLANRLARGSEFRTLTGFTDTFLWDVQTRPLAPPVSLLDRLQLYNPMTQMFDTPVTPGSITSTAGSPTNVYFIAHGWAPGYEEDVLLHSTPGNPLRVWQTVQFPGGFPMPGPDSPWLFEGIDRVSVESLAQAIHDADPMARVVAFSWIDESATPAPGNVGLDNLEPFLYAGQSEAATQLNGLRLAQAIQSALSGSFFPGLGLIHLLGHSHGAKVAAVATLALQRTGVPVTQLTTLESPESGPLEVLHLPGLGGAQNFDWYYMLQMQLSRSPVNGRTPAPPVNGQHPTFIDNYFSEFGFGQAFGSYVGLNNLVVDVELHPEVLYPPNLQQPASILDTVFGSHDYPPPWYGQASIQQANPTVALGWSPLLNPAAAANLMNLYGQTWMSPPVFSQQFTIAPQGGPPPPMFTPTFTPLEYARQYTVGSTTDNGSSLTLSVSPDQPTSVLAMTFNPQAAVTGNAGNGLDFQFQFSGVDPNERVELVVWVRGQVAENVSITGGPAVNQTLGYTSIPLFAMGGTEAASAPQSATISLDGFLKPPGPWGLFNASIAGPFNSSPVPLLGFSLISSAGSNASVTLTQLRQFTDGIAG